MSGCLPPHEPVHQTGPRNRTGESTKQCPRMTCQLCSVASPRITSPVPAPTHAHPFHHRESCCNAPVCLTSSWASFNVCHPSLSRALAQQPSKNGRYQTDPLTPPPYDTPRLPQRPGSCMQDTSGWAQVVTHLGESWATQLLLPMLPPPPPLPLPPPSIVFRPLNRRCQRTPRS